MTGKTLEITNGRYFVAQTKRWEPFESIRIEKKHICSIDQQSDSNAELTIDAKGGMVIPGLVDLNASLREPGNVRNGSIASETYAAAASGITHLCCTPDTTPINDSKAVSKLMLELASESGKCKVLPLGALTQQLQGRQLANLHSLKQAGCIAVSNADASFESLLVAQRCFEYAQTLELPVFVSPKERDLYDGCVHEGRISTEIGLKGIPYTAESIAVAQLVQLAQETGVKLHLSQISSEASVKLIADAKASGLNITADAAIANLLFTEKAVEGFNSLYHCHPPLRTERDRQALLRGVRDGVIDTIVSGHRPWEAAEKLMPFAESAPGMSTLEFLIPAAMQLAETGELPIEDFLTSMSDNARAVLNLDPLKIQTGEIANLAIVDAETHFQTAPGDLLSKGVNTPFVGKTLKGKVMTTICEGELTFLTP